MIPKIRSTSFGDKLLHKLFYVYPKLNELINYGQYSGNFYPGNWNYMNYGFINRIYKGYQKGNNNNYINKFNNQEKENYTMENNYDLINNDKKFNNRDIKNNNNKNNNNSPINNIYNINNNTINININSNIESKEHKKDSLDKNKINAKKNNTKINNFHLLPEQKK